MKDAIPGCCIVGSTTGYALVMNGVGREIGLVDLSHQGGEAEVNDICHAVRFAYPLAVRDRDYPEKAQAPRSRVRIEALEAQI